MIIKSKMKKGVVVAVAAVAIVAAALIEAVMFSSLIENTLPFRRADMETAVTAAADWMEFLKQSMQNAVSYSFYNATYEVAKRGGYAKIPDSVPSEGGTAYWINNSGKYMPTQEDFTQALGIETLKAFNSYGKSHVANYKNVFRVTLVTPTYSSEAGSSCGSVSITGTGRARQVSISGSGCVDFSITGGFFTLEESNKNFVDSVSTNVFELYEIGKSKFVDPSKDPISLAVSQAVGEMGNTEVQDWEATLRQKIKTKLAEAKATVNQDLTNAVVDFEYADSGIRVFYCASCTEKYSAEVKVKVKIHGDVNDASNYQPIFDGDMNWRYATLQFYVSNI